MTALSDRYMRATDAFSWYVEEDPALRSTIVAVAWLDAQPDFEVLRHRLERATRLVPRFRQRPVEAPARFTTPRWVDEGFDLSLHLQRMEAPAPHTPETVLDFVRAESMTGFDRSRPLWRFTLVEHLAEERAALVMKVHHSLTDGVGGMQLALLLFEATKEPGTESMPDVGSPELLGALDLVRDGVVRELGQAVALCRGLLRSAVPGLARAARHPIGTAGELAETAASVLRTVQPVTETLSPVMTARSLDRRAGMLSVPLAALKAGAAEAGGSVNDGFVAAITGGLRRYHEHHGAAVNELRVTMPISLRKASDEVGGNRITLQRFTVPVGLRDPTKRIRAVGRRCREARLERSLSLTDSIASGLNLLPASVIGSMLKHVDFLASNVPGVPFPIFLAGAPVTGYFSFSPTIGSAINVTLISYAGTCCIGVNVDAAAVADVPLMMECLAEGFQEVLALAGDGAEVTDPIATGAFRSGPNA